MGAIADHVATMRGCSLSQIVAEIERMERGCTEDDLFNGEANALINGEGSEFDIAWMDWPNKTAKKSAEKAFNAARKRGVSFQMIHNGMMRYVMTKPADRPWMHLATFINGERWLDQPAAPTLKGVAAQRATLRQEIADGYERDGQANRNFGHDRRLAIGGPVDDQRERRRLL